MMQPLQQHERVKCIVPGNAINSTHFIELDDAGRITHIFPRHREAQVRFDKLQVDVRLPLSHLRTETFTEGHTKE